MGGREERLGGPSAGEQPGRGTWEKLQQRRGVSKQGSRVGERERRGREQGWQVLDELALCI